jgi:hypothetical protein
MECNKWDESGLLYLSKELDEGLQNEFSSHLSKCSFCSDELSQYSLEKRSFFSSEILGVQTTPELDTKILNRCRAAVPTTVGLAGTLWLKRIVFSALVFAFGAGAGGYFTFAYYHAKSDAAIAAANAKKAIAPVAATTFTASSVQASSPLSFDTTKPNSKPDPFKKNSRMTPSQAGTVRTPPQGIITVDLKKE